MKVMEMCQGCFSNQAKYVESVKIEIESYIILQILFNCCYFTEKEIFFFKDCVWQPLKEHLRKTAITFKFQ